MLNRVISAVFIGYMAATSILFFLIALLLWLGTVLFDRRLRLLHLFTCFWAYLYIWSMPAWKLTRKGLDKIDKQKTYVVVSNHQSQLDILVAFGLFFHFKWVSKLEIFRVPLIGWNMWLNRYVPLKRGDTASIKKMYDLCEKRLQEGSSVYFFPEGTRSKTGEMRPFKPGAFILAKKLQLPILPISITGTRAALPKYSMNFHGIHEIFIEVLDEIPYKRFSHMEPHEIAAMTRQVIGTKAGGLVLEPMGNESASVRLG